MGFYGNATYYLPNGIAQDIIDYAINESKLAENAVTRSKIADNAISKPKITTHSIHGAAGTKTDTQGNPSTHIATETIAGGKGGDIAPNTIQGYNIDEETITPDKLSTNFIKYNRGTLEDIDNLINLTNPEGTNTSYAAIGLYQVSTSLSNNKLHAILDEDLNLLKNAGYIFVVRLGENNWSIYAEDGSQYKMVYTQDQYKITECQLTTDDIANKAIDPNKISTQAVHGAASLETDEDRNVFTHIATETIAGGKGGDIAPNTIQGYNIDEETITQANMHNDSIGTDEIIEYTVCGSYFSDDKIHIKPGSITTNDLADGAITFKKIDPNLITEDGALNVTTLPNKIIHEQHIAPGEITLEKLNFTPQTIIKIPADSSTFNTFYDLQIYFENHKNEVMNPDICHQCYISGDLSQIFDNSECIKIIFFNHGWIILNPLTQQYWFIAQGIRPIIPADNISKIVLPIDSIPILNGAKIEEGVICGSYSSDENTVIHIKPGSIGTIDLGPQVVTAEQIAPTAIITEKIYPGAVTTEKIDLYAVTSGKIEDGAITTNKIANQAITLDHLSLDLLDHFQAVPGGHYPSTSKVHTLNSNFSYATIPLSSNQRALEISIPSNWRGRTMLFLPSNLYGSSSLTSFKLSFSLQPQANQSQEITTVSWWSTISYNSTTTSRQRTSSSTETFEITLTDFIDSTNYSKPTCIIFDGIDMPASGNSGGTLPFFLGKIDIRLYDASTD